MTFFIPSARARRTAAFEQITAHTHEVLVRPEIQQALGDLAAPMFKLHKNLFLPNVRHGVAHVPEAYTDDYTRVAFLPIHRGEDANKLLSVISNDPGPPQPFKASVSPYTHLVVSAKEKRRESVSGRPRRRDSRHNLAFTRVHWSSTEGSPLRPMYSASRIIEVVRTHAVGNDARKQAIVATHEHAHALDVLFDPLQIQSPKFRTVSELFANHVSSIFIDHLYTRPPFWTRDMIKMENIRRAHTTPNRPYSPNQQLFAALAKAGLSR